MKSFISLIAAILMLGSFSSIASAAEAPSMPKLNLLHVEKAEAPYSVNPLAENIIKVGRYVRWRHGRKQICHHRHCGRWGRRHSDHGGHHYHRVCLHWHYSRCRYVRRRHHHHHHDNHH